MYKDRFWKESYFEALNRVKDAAGAEGISLVEAALRWLYHYSALQDGDGVIIGGVSAQIRL